MDAIAGQLPTFGFWQVSADMPCGFWRPGGSDEGILISCHVPVIRFFPEFVPFLLICPDDISDVVGLAILRDPVYGHVGGTDGVFWISIADVQGVYEFGFI